MIVVCTSCKAKFRIPDEKVGAKGAKVRCSKCKTVFIVKRELAAPAPAAATEADPFALGSRPSQDPFAAVQDRSPPPAAPDPFALSGDDPFAAAASAAGETTASHLPLTDLSDLAGARGAAGSGPTALAPPLPPAPRPSIPDLASSGDPMAALPPPLPRAAAPSPGGDVGLSLEESTSAGAPIPAADFPGFDSLESQMAVGGEESGLELGGDLYRAGGAAAAEPPASPEITAEVSQPERPRAPRPAPAARPPLVAVRPSAPDLPQPAAGAERGRLRSLLVNSLSLAVLLLVTLGMLALSRGEGTLLERALGRGQATPTPVVATQVTSGLYETAHGRALLFVRGAVRSQSAAPLGPVLVRAEIVVGNQVVARAEGLAGAVATPEELSVVGGQEDADRLRAALAPRAQREIRPGESVPFLLTFTDWPEDLGGATFRVAAEPAPAQRG
jgi:predicted Zn finger-like uncharacterized protein